MLKQADVVEGPPGWVIQTQIELGGGMVHI
jgi:hypothetical protein